MTTEESKLQPIEHYRAVRSQIEHEDNLVAQRLSWLLASQSFLFTAYAITLNGPVQSHFKSFEASSALLMSLLGVVGIVSAVLIWVSILAGMAAMRKLRLDFERYVGSDLPRSLPPIQTRGLELRFGQLGPLLIPLLFIAVWTVLLVRG
jgi:hypothetical protein